MLYMTYNLYDKRKKFIIVYFFHFLVLFWNIFNTVLRTNKEH